MVVVLLLRAAVGKKTTKAKKSFNHFLQTFHPASESASDSSFLIVPSSGS